MRILVTVVTTLIVLVAIGALYVWAGVYHVAAAEPHDPVVRWFLTTLQSQAVAAHSDGIAPPSLTESTRIRAGAHIYDGMCRTCHGAPGHDPSEIGQGLNPLCLPLPGRVLGLSSPRACQCWCIADTSAPNVPNHLERNMPRFSGIRPIRGSPSGMVAMAA
jgi:hypothetical protein